jgi:hypothetical protein
MRPLKPFTGQRMAKKAPESPARGWPPVSSGFSSVGSSGIEDLVAMAHPCESMGPMTL